MKKIKWKIAAFVAWVVITLMVVDVGLRGVSKADTSTNLVSVAILLFWILVSIATNCLTFKNKKMKKIKFVFMLSLILSALCLTSCSERIDAGSEGILVNLYGSDKGVDDVSLVTGRVWYNPFTEEVYEYPTFVQTIDYPAFTINAKDGSEFTVDPTVSLKMVDGNAPRVFKKYRKELKDIVNGTLFNYVKDAFRIQLNKYTTDQIVSNRDLVERAIEAQLSKALAREHFHLEQLTSGLKYPSSIVEAVNQKNKAIQEAQRALNEVAVKKAEAEKMLVQARAEREANELKTASLTPAILKKMWIEKWDGKLPVYGNVPQMMMTTK